MVKKIFTKMILASTLFLGGIFGVSIANSVENKNDASMQNRTVNVKRSGENQYKQYSYTMTFNELDVNQKNLYRYVLNPDTFENCVTVHFEDTNHITTESNGNQLNIERNTSVHFIPEEGIEIDQITTEATSGALGSNKNIKNGNYEYLNYGKLMKIYPLDKGATVSIKNDVYNSSRVLTIIIDYHFASYSENSNADNHWQECVCGNKKDVVNHTWDTKEILSAPTHEAAGETKYTCKCGQTKTDLTYPNVTDSETEVKLINSLTYNGADQTQEIEVTYAGVKLEKDTHYTISGDVKKDAGEYTLTIEGTGLFEGTRTIDYTIAKAPLTIAADSKEVIYGQTAPTYTVSYNGLVNNETKDVLSGELAINCDYEQYDNAGNYSIIASGLTSSNYEITYVDGNLKVNPKEIGLEWSTNLEFIYDGEAHKPTATVTGLVNNDTCTVTVVGEKVNVGTHTATAEVLSNSNYKLPTEGLEKNYTISPKSISGATITLGESLTYTGNELTQEVESVVLDGIILVEGTDYEISANKQTNAGTEYELIINGIGNYTGTLTKEFVVAKQKVDLPTANTNLIYTGTEVTGVSASNLYDVVDGTAVNAGSHTATVTLKNSSNYEWAEEFDGKVEYAISKAQLTIITESKEVIYGDAVPTYTVSYNGLVNNETSSVLGGTLSFVSSYSQTSNVGEYDVAASGLTSENYEITYVDGKVIVSQKEVGLTWGETQFTYNGSSQLPTVTLTGLVNNDTCEVTVTGEQINAGSYEATVTALSNENYKLPVNVTTEYVINKATHNMSGITFNNVTVTYDGSEHEVVLDGILPSGVEVTYTTNKGTNAGTYNAVATFTYDAENYNVVADMNAVLTINKATHDMSSVSFNDVTVTYDGNKHEVVLDGMLPTGVEVTYSTNKGTNAGTYNAVATFTYDTENYNVIENKTATLTINKATYDMSGITFENVTVTYDGNEHEVVLDGTLPTGVEVTYSTNKGTNVGTYNAVATFTYDTENYNAIADMHAVLTISKATHDMSGVSFNDVTVTYDGSEHEVVLGGILPTGVEVTYSTNKGTNVGTYNAVATFTYDTENYNTIADMHAVLTISKAKASITVDTNDINVIYGDTITLPEGTTNFGEVVVNRVDMINVGEYKVTYDVASTNNYDGDTKEVKVIISPLAVSEPTLKGTYTYTSNEQTVELNGLESFMTIASGNKQTNAGNYEVVITLDDNHVWKEGSDGKIAWSIAKATYNMSGVSFENKTVVENGENQALTITGTLPNGVTATYSLTECIEPGVYEIIASFTGDANNYEAISSMKANLTIKQSELEPETNFEEGHENDVIVSSPEGIDPNKQLVIEMVEVVQDEKDYSNYLEKNQKAAIAYEIKLLDKNGMEVQPDGTLVIKILIPERLRGREFGIMHIHAGNQKAMMEYTIEEEYVVIHTDKLSEFVFVYETGSILWLIIVLGVLALLEAGLLVYLILKDKQIIGIKTYSVIPPFVFGMFVLAWEIVMVIVLIAIVASLAVIDILYALKLLKAKQ